MFLTPDNTALRDLSHLDLVRSGMALQAVGSQGSAGVTAGSQLDHLAAMVAYDETWGEHLFRESGNSITPLPWDSKAKGNTIGLSGERRVLSPS